MRLRNQRDCLTGKRRKTELSCWKFSGEKNDADGNHARRTGLIGTVISGSWKQAPGAPRFGPFPTWLPLFR
jgi:hypothetical protein